ncbi:MAG: protein kinase domain-containing protein, partial [Bradymonadaceae bacterium]
HYLAPEQILGKKLSPASDIYSLGMVTYEMLVGRRANMESTPMDVIGRQIDPQAFVIPEDFPVHNGLRHLIETMINKDVEQRFESAQEVLLAMQRLSEEDEDDPTTVITADQLLAFTEDEDPTTIVEGPLASRDSIRISAMSDNTPSKSREYEYGAPSVPRIYVLGTVVGLIMCAILIGAIIFIFTADHGQDPSASDELPPDSSSTSPTAMAGAASKTQGARSADDENSPFTLKVTTSPPGLPVYVDDRLAGLSPLELDLHGFSFPATISSRLHARSSRSVMLTRPSHFVHLDFGSTDDEASVLDDADVADKPAVLLEVALPEKTEEPVEAQLVEKSPRPATQRERKRAPVIKKAPQPVETEKTEAEEAPEEPVKVEKPDSSPFNLPALDNIN